MESWQFRRAVYRLMLLAQVFEADDMDFGFQSEADLDEETTKRKEFLLQFPNYELFPVHSVSIFLKEVAQWAEIAENSYECLCLLTSQEILCNQSFLMADEEFGDLALAHGPERILEAYQTQDTQTIREIADSDDMEIFQGYLANPLSSIWEARKTKPPASDSTHWKSILDVIQGENDTCEIRLFSN